MSERKSASSSYNRLSERTVEAELQGSFLAYAMSVLTDRAIPDARDGLKPVQRRIIYAMHEAGLVAGKPYKKCATVVGDVLGKYHPHGDSSVYEALVRLAQDFTMAEPLIDGQGNFGSIDGDSAAAYRYTEARLSGAAMEMVKDIEKDTVDVAPNFDDRLREPRVLPSTLPNLLLNGSVGIAVGMATSVPPHNLGELAQAIMILCERPDACDEDVYAPIKGPDFPTGGLLSADEIDKFKKTGRGRLLVRARVHIESTKNGRSALVFTEIPYGITKTRILEKIGESVFDKKIHDIADMRDESDREGLRIVVDLKRDADTKKVLAQLYKYTGLQSTFAGNLLALVDGTPKTLSLRTALEVFIAHRLSVIVRRSRHDIEQAEARLHILEGLLVAIDAIDDVVRLIKKAASTDEARDGLVRKFSLTEIQAQAILDLQLRRLTALDVKKLTQEKKDLLALTKDLRALLASEAKQREVVRNETREIADRYARPRRTRIITGDALAEIQQKAATESLRVYVSADGQAWTEPAGSRIRTRTLKGEDPAIFALNASADTRLVVFTDGGRFYPLDVREIGDTSARPRNLSNMLEGMNDGEKPLAVYPAEAMQAQGASMVFVSALGQIKRTLAGEYATPRSGGIIGASINEGDALVSTFLAREDDHVVLASDNGFLIRFPLDQVPDQGRSARGVRGMKVPDHSRVIYAGVLSATLALMTRGGFVRRIGEPAVPAQGRGGVGVRVVRDEKSTGALVWAASCNEMSWAWTVDDAGAALPVPIAEFLPGEAAGTWERLAIRGEIRRGHLVPDHLGGRLARLRAGKNAEASLDDGADAGRPGDEETEFEGEA